MTLRESNRVLPGLRWPAIALALLAGIGGIPEARAQISQLSNMGSHRVSPDQPVTFSADRVEYDREHGIVTATGNVEAWQAGRVVRADKMTFDRNTGIVVATGNVALLETDGQVLFAQYAELSRDMSEGLLKTVEAAMAQNGKMAANGMRRTGGTLNEMSRVVYTSCDLCKKDPTRPPLWEMQAASAIQDTEHLTIEYRDATLRMWGYPVAYFPYMVTPDPSKPRQSGLLPPIFGNSSSTGVFFGQPYYWVIDGASDATFTPLATTQVGGLLDTQYRHRYNDGNLILNLSGGYDHSFEGSIATRGQFAIDDTWRWGFDINRASSSEYILHQHLLLGLTGDANILPATAYVEGFGEGSYTRLDVKGYQALTASVASSELPLVLPRYMYSYSGEPDALGGRLTLDAGAFNVVRTVGTNTRRANLSMTWDRPFQGPLGDLWSIAVHGDSAAYDASQFTEIPNFAPHNSVETAQGQAGLAVNLHWPFMRDSGTWGTQLIEPILQFIAQPRMGDSQLAKIPNEDSLSFEFTDENLFGFNRFSGIDRLEGGSRVNAALHGAWYLSGTVTDALIGQSYRDGRDSLFPAASGLRDPVSDVVARVTFSPSKFLDVTYRTRLDHDSLATRYAEAVAATGTDKFRLTGGYIFTTFDPYYFYDTAQPPLPTSGYYQARNEVTAGATSKWEHWRFGVNARRDLASNQWISYGANAAYEDECFIFDMRFTRRFTSLLNDNGATALLFFFTFKTVGQFYWRAK